MIHIDLHLNDGGEQYIQCKTWDEAEKFCREYKSDQWDAVFKARDGDWYIGHEIEIMDEKFEKYIGVLCIEGNESGRAPNAAGTGE